MLPVGYSDHDAVVTRVNFVRARSVQSDSGHSYRRISYERLRAELEAVEWSDVISCESVSEAWDRLHSSVSRCMESSTETLEFRGRSKKKRAPWASCELIRECNRKSALYKLARQYPLNMELRKNFKLLSKRVAWLSMRDKIQYYGRELDRCKLDAAAYWRKLNELAVRDRRRVEAVVVDGNTYFVTDNADKVADCFAVQFGKVNGVVVRGDDSGSSLIEFPTDNYIESSFAFRDVTGKEVVEAAGHLSNSCSVGHNGIASRVIKCCIGAFADTVALLCNRSVVEGEYPAILRKAVVVPIHKSGSDRSR